MKELVIRHDSMLRHASVYVADSPSHSKRGFIKTKEPIMELKVANTQTALINDISRI